MQGLASFDRLLTRGRTDKLAPGAPSPSRQLISPAGDAVARLPFPCAPDAILRAAHRIAADDWLGVIADDGRQTGLASPWRLALLRADRHGQPRLSRDAGPLWLSTALPARPGLRPQALRQRLQVLALQSLWQAGWRLA